MGLDVAVLMKHARSKGIKINSTEFAVLLITQQRPGVPLSYSFLAEEIGCSPAAVDKALRSLRDNFKIDHRQDKNAAAKRWTHQYKIINWHRRLDSQCPICGESTTVSGRDVATVSRTYTTPRENSQVRSHLEAADMSGGPSLPGGRRAPLQSAKSTPKDPPRRVCEYCGVAPADIGMGCFDCISKIALADRDATA